MTVRINFLPRAYQPPKPLDRRQWGVIGAAAVALAATGMYYTSVYAGALRLEGETQATQVKLQEVKAGLAQAAAIQTREEKVTKAEIDLKSLTGRHWSSVVIDLRESTPQHVTWTSLKVSDDTILLKGTNRGLVDVAQLMGSLVNNTEVEQVNLHYVNEEGIPVTVAAKSGAAKPSSGPGGAGNDPAKEQKPAPQATILGEFRQLEFELEIKLIGGSEGGTPANGA